MITLVADDNALCRELIRELLEGTGKPKSLASNRSFGIPPHSLTYMLSAFQLLKETIM
jgi:CheY-like chemotaxis protein